MIIDVAAMSRDNTLLLIDLNITDLNAQKAKLLTRLQEIPKINGLDEDEKNDLIAAKQGKISKIDADIVSLTEVKKQI